MAARQIGVMIMVLMLALGGLTACGKRAPLSPVGSAGDTTGSSS